MLTAEADTAYKKAWHRLERGLRLNRLRAFSENLGVQRSLKPAEQQNLLTLLTKALDKKLLNSKTAVVYDAEKEEITEIKPLMMHQNSAGEVLFQIVERRNAVTFRKRPSSAEED
jgi:membrane-bound lytic murein transglycosylase MltF